MTSLKILMYVFLGGGLGSSARFLLSQYESQMYVGQALGPVWATAFVNILGCFCLGFCRAFFLTESHHTLMIMTGFLGGFTTFSGFIGIFDSFMKSDLKINGLCFLLGQIILGFAALKIGVYMALLIRKI